MAHDGSSRLNEFASFTDGSENDLSVAGKLSLSSQGNLKPLAAGGFLASTDILSPSSGTGFDTSSLGLINAITSAGHVDGLTVNLSTPTTSVALTDATANFSSAFDVLGAPAITGTLQTMADYLRVGFWNDRGQIPHQFNLGSSGNWANSGTIFYNVSGFSSSLSTDYGTEGADSNGLTGARQTMVREAFKMYSAVLGINFVETTSTDTNVVDFFFKDNVANTAYEAERTDSGFGGNVHYTVINVDVNWFSGLSNIGGVNAYTFQTFIHEIAHGLGLGHQGLYNAGSGSPTYANSATYINDSWQQTMMSYWSQTENTEYSDDSYAQLVTPMAVDWIALNAIYSGQGYGTANAFTGDTVYGVGTNISTATSVAFANLATYAATNAFTIVDGNGTDTIDFSNYNANQIIDLYISTASQTHAWLSSVGGLTKNMTIAVGVVIENATSGGGNDTLYGNTASNILTANGGNDYVYDGYGGNDTMYGGAGNDSLYAGSNSDYLDGGDGNDYMSGNGGGDVLYGGAGTDTIYGGAGNDFISVVGSGNFSDSDVAYGGDDDDFMIAGLGTETLDGGAGTDTVYLAYWNGDYQLDMATGVTNYGGESYVNFEGVYFGNGNDTVTAAAGVNTTVYGGDGSDQINGNSGADSLYGGLGDDTINGQGGVDKMYGGDGNDTFVIQDGWTGGAGEVVDGGAGNDTFDISATSVATSVIDLTAGTFTYTPGGSGPIALVSIENVVGSNGDDSITGNGSANMLYGGAGNDTINGLGGVDQMYGGAGNDVFTLQDGWTGGAGELIDGGSDSDTFDISATSVATSVIDLAAGTFTYTPGGSGPIALASIENVVGSNGDDAVYGNSSDNTVSAGVGNDVVYGNDGNDNLDGGSGNDYLAGGTGTDILTGGIGDDVLYAYSSPGFAESDSIYGGAGNDSVYVGYGGAATMDGGADIDMLWLADNAANYVFDMGTGVTNQAGEVYTNFEIVFMGAGNDSVTGTSGNETIYGGAGNDTLNDGYGFDSVYGGAGNDLVIAGDSSFQGDSWYGGDDTDTLSYAAFSWGTPVAPVIFDFVSATASYNGFVEIISGFEILQGSQGDETMISDGNGHSFYGNDGNDSMVSSTGVESMYGGNGIDTIDHRAYGGNYTFTMWNGLTNISGETFLGFEVAYMGDGNDVVIGTAGDNTIYGGLGNDTIRGLGSLVGDLIYGGDGNDSIVATAGAATLDGGNGIDTLDNFAINSNVTFDMNTGVTNIAGHTYLNFEVAIMGAGNDSITGSNSNDTIYANAGNDSMYGGGGVDALYGYAGNDYFRYVTGAGYDNMYGGTGTDSVVFEAFFGDKLTIDLLLGTYNTGGPVFAIVGMENVTTSTGNDSVSGSNDNNYIEASDGNDTIFGAGGNDGVFGGNGNDFIRGGTGNDVIGGGVGDDLMGGDDGNDSMFGAAGNDAMYGGNGNDALYGGLGNDILMGNAGNDVFVFTGTVFGTDRIMDFIAPGLVDKIDFTALVGITSFADLSTNHLTTVAGNAVITLGASTITIVGVLGSALLADDFVF